MKRYNIIVIALAIVALAICLRDCSGWHHQRGPASVDTVTIRTTDTVWIHDTITITKPVPVKSDSVRNDTVFMTLVKPNVEPNDTLDNQFADHRTNGSPCDYLLTSIDSVRVVVPITERTYQDRRYKAVVSGYDPKLVSLDIYSERSVVHNTIVERKPAKLSISAGIYGGYGPKGFDYGLGIMLGIPIFSWTW